MKSWSPWFSARARVRAEMAEAERDWMRRYERAKAFEKYPDVAAAI